MNDDNSNLNQPNLPADNENKKIFLLGSSLYPAVEDIYHQSQKEDNINPEDIDTIKESNEKNVVAADNEKDFKDDISGSDLDIPGSDLDDEQENIGNEDEENNYYSLGGDDHNSLDEDNGE